ALGDAQRGGDLGYRQVDDVPEDDGGALFVGQEGEQGLEFVAGFAAGGRVFHALAGVGGFHGLLAEVGRGFAGFGAGTVAPDVHEDGDEPRPRPERGDAVAVVAGQRPVRAQERLGGQVLGVGPPAAEPQRGGEHERAVRGEQLGEPLVEVVEERFAYRVKTVHVPHDPRNTAPTTPVAPKRTTPRLSARPPRSHAKGPRPGEDAGPVVSYEGQTATASSATSPSLACTCTSRVTPPPAMMRTVQSPGPAKKRKMPSSDTTTSPVNS